MRPLVNLVTFARIVLYLAYALAVVWLAYRAADELAPAAPVATMRLDANHLLAPGDLSTSAINHLLHHYLREPVEIDKPVTAEMVSERPVAPVMPSGVAVIVNVEKRGMPVSIAPDRQVKVTRDGRTLVDKGTVIAMPCDENRCAVVIGLEKGPAIESSALAGADIAPVTPSVQGAPSAPATTEH